MAPPFQFQAFQADPQPLMAALMARGNAIARGDEGAGQAWAGAAQNIGNDVSGTLNSILKQKLEEPQRQAQALQLKALQREDATATALDATKKTVAGMMADPTLLNEDGTFNVKAMADKLSTAPHPSGVDATALYGILDPINKSLSEARDHKMAWDQSKTNAIAHVANAALTLGAPTEANPQGTVLQHAQLGLAALLKSGQITQDDANKFLVPMVEQPESVPTLLKSAIAQSTVPPIKLTKDEQLRSGIDPTQVLASNAAPPQNEAELAADAANPKSPTAKASADALAKLQAPALAARTETARHNTELERIASLTSGREAAQAAETARHNRATEQAANPFGVGAGSGAPGAPAAGTAGPTGDDFLKGLAPGIATQVKALAEGRQPFPTGMSYAKLQPLIQLVTQYDPSFDAANYNARNKARTDLTNPSGQGGKIVNSLNTAIQHAGKLSDLIEALGNGDTPAVNAVSNWFSKQSGSSKVTNFEAVQPQLMKEIERLWRGAGGSSGDIDELKKTMGPNMGIQQQRDALAQFVGLMQGKLETTEQQRDNILGPTAGKSVPILFDQSKPVLAKITQRAGGAAAPVTPAAVTVTSTTPIADGKVKIVLSDGRTLSGDKADVDAFVKALAK